MKKQAIVALPKHCLLNRIGVPKAYNTMKVWMIHHGKCNSCNNAHLIKRLTFKSIDKQLLLDAVRDFGINDFDALSSLIASRW